MIYFYFYFKINLFNFNQNYNSSFALIFKMLNNKIKILNYRKLNWYTIYNGFNAKN